MLSAFAQVDDRLLGAVPPRRRYQRFDLTDHQTFDGPKRVLSLDGGGVRTAMSIAVLGRIEALLRERHGGHRGFRLSDYFDLVGGTSTGAIVAALVAASNFTIADIRDAYFELARDVYGQRHFRLGDRGQHGFDGKRLQDRLSGIFGRGALGDDRISTGLAILTRRADQDTTQVYHNHPAGPLYDVPDNEGLPAHKDLPLATLLRAATGVPERFAPEPVNLTGEPRGRSGLFVDGSVTSHNNPALQLYLLATLTGQGYEWATGASSLQVVSVGTGALCRRIAPAEARHMRHAGQNRAALDAMMDGADHTGDMVLKLLSDSASPTLEASPFDTPGGGQITSEPQLAYRRYQARLARDHLLEAYGLGLTTKQLDRVRTMTNPDGLQIAYEIGQAMADRLVRPEDFDAAFDLPPHPTSVGAPPSAESGITDAHARPMPPPVLPQAPSVRGRLR